MGRALTFADATVIKMATEQFISVCTDDWYTRRRQDDEGTFFRRMATASGRKGDGGETRQGIYVFAADGTSLGYKNAGQHPDIMKKMFAEALAKFQNLPAGQREPGSILVPTHGKLDAKYTRELPADGLILRTHARILDAKGDGYVVGKTAMPGGSQASRDFIWLTKQEVATLLPTKPEIGFSYPVPEKIALRLARYHLVDNTRGEPSFWKKADIRAKAMTLTVVAITTEEIELTLTMNATLATNADVAKAERGFEVASLGKLRYSTAKQKFVQFDVASLGQHWGDHHHNGEARAGKNPLGLWWTLAEMTKASNTVWPQGIRDKGPYLDG